MSETPVHKASESSVEFRLRQFAVLANKQSPHPRDWRRFYNFVVYAHSRRVGWDEYDLKVKLKAFGFDERHAAEFSTAYWHGRCTLYMAKPRAMHESYHGWTHRGGIAST